MKKIYALEDWCINCRRCEVACKAFHSVYKDAVKAYQLKDTMAFNRVHVEGGRELSIAVNCRHCAKPKCVEGCISGAMQKDPVTGVVTSDPARCVGCRTCVSMCPFGCVKVEPAGMLPGGLGAKPIAIKCDLCGDGHGQPGEPSCVAACPNRALIYVESEVR
jgi:carbon-monoxide dehydrogenase iron sulfur subunit